MSIAAPQPVGNQGQPVPRVDGRLKVTGQAIYASDVDPKNVAYAYLVTSTISKGSVTTIDDTEARKVDGVIEIFSHNNMAEAIKEIPFKSAGGQASTSIVPLSSSKIWHYGQIVAMIVADRFETAREAAYRLDVRYVEEAPAAGIGSPGATSIPIGEAKQAKKFENPKVGDFDKAFAAAPVTVSADYATPTQHHNPIELFTTTCQWDGGNLLIHEPSQDMIGLQQGIAKELAVDPTLVRTLSPFIGGAFGSKGTITPRTAIVAVAAKRLNRPVKLVVSRAQGFYVATYRAETRQTVKLGADKTGKLLALSHEGTELTSRPDDYAVHGTDATTRMYACPNVASAVTLVKADRNTPGFMRAPAETPYMFGLESAIDELAETLGMDPIELRRVNDTMKEPINGLPFTSRSAMRCFDAASKSFDWSRRNPKPGQTRQGEWLVGYGCAMACYPTNIAPAAVRVRLEANGDVRVETAGHEIGTGIYTVAAQTAAMKLGVDVAKVKVVLGDSSLPPAPTAGGSNSTASICNAIAKACEAVNTRLYGKANLDQQTVREGRLVSKDGNQDHIGKAFAASSASAIEEYAEFVPKGSKPGAMAKLYQGTTTFVGGPDGQEHVVFSFGAQFVEVHIHARTKDIRVPRVVGAFAAGHIVNTRTAHSQLMGGMIWGLSSGLHEVTEIDQGRASYVNNNLADYLVPVNADIGMVDVIMVPEVDEIINPLGIKGIGELGVVGASAALANAVYNATGVRVRDLPVRIDKLIGA